MWADHVYNLKPLNHDTTVSNHNYSFNLTRPRPTAMMSRESARSTLVTHSRNYRTMRHKGFKEESMTSTPTQPFFFRRSYFALCWRRKQSASDIDVNSFFESPLSLNLNDMEHENRSITKACYQWYYLANDQGCNEGSIFPRVQRPEN